MKIKLKREDKMSKKGLKRKIVAVDINELPKQRIAQI